MIRMFIRRSYRFFIGLALLAGSAFPLTAQIVGPATAIVGQPTTWTCGMSGTTSFTWNIGDVSNLPLAPQLIAREIVTNPIEIPDYLSVCHDPSNGHWYVLFLSAGITAAQFPTQQNLWRVDLGTDPTTGIPPGGGNPTNLGNFGLGHTGMGSGSGDCAHAVVYDSARGEWSVFLIKTGYNTGSGANANTLVSIKRVDFGNTLANNPTTATTVNTPAANGGTVFDIQVAGSKIVKDQGNYFLFIGNRWGQPGRVNFGSDVRNVNPVCSMLPSVVTHGVGVGTSTLLRSSAFDIVQQDGQWYMFTATTDGGGSGGSKWWRQDFGNSLGNTPMRVTGLGSTGFGSHYWAIRIIPGKCGSEFYGYAQHSQGSVQRIDFNGDLTTVPTVLGDVGSRGVNGWPNIGPQTPWDPSGFATFVYKDSLYAITGGNTWRKLYITNLQYNFGSSPVHKYPPDNSFTHTFTTPGTYDITLTVNMDDHGSAQFCKTITVVGTPLPPVYTLAPANVCKVDTLMYVVDSVPGITSYEWTYTGSGVQYASTTTVPRNELIFTAAATDGILRVRASNSYGNSAYSDTMIRVRQTPWVTLTPSDTQRLCEGDSLRLTASAGSAVVYQWQRNGINVGNGGPQYVTGQDGIYTVTVSTLDGFCPVTSSAVTVQVNPQPVADLGNDTNVCVSALPLTLSSPQPPGVHYLWSNGLSTTDMQVTRGGTYWLEVSIGDCAHRDSIIVRAIEDPEVYIGADTTICEQFPLRIGDEILGATYTWNTGARTAYTHVNATGDYILFVDLDGCVVSDTIHVTAMPVPDIDLGPDGDICPDQTIALDATYGNGSTYSWNTGETTASIAVTRAGTYSVQVISEHRCVGGDTIILAHYPKPTVSLGPDTTVCQETPLVLRPWAINTDSLIWSDGSVGEELAIRYGGEIIVTAVNKCGTGSDTLTVKDIFCDIWVPNAFTPNSDGINDMFRALGNIGQISGFGLSVYNRWGERIFHTSDKYEGWDGSYKGVPAALGTYVYMLKFDRGGKTYERKGSFHLIR
jgi:gliding motility-associated-like protein